MTGRRILLAAVLVAVAATLMGAGGTQEADAPPPPAEQILAGVEKAKGFRPPALEVMSGREGTLESFMIYGKRAFDGGPLSERESYLAALAAAVALRSPTCIRAHSESAIRAGATEEEVLQAALIAGVVSGTSALHVAHEASDILRP